MIVFCPSIPEKAATVCAMTQEEADRMACDYFPERYPDGNYPDTWYDTYQEKCEAESGFVINTLSFGVTVFCAIFSIFKF